MGYHDVFLNHRGPDLKDGFISHLHEALWSAGLNPFLDKKSLIKGYPAFISINDALQNAKVHVAVISRGYPYSKWCLNELVEMMRSEKPVIPVFYNVEPAHLRQVPNGPFGEAFEKHNYGETTEQVEEWADALRKLANITGFCYRSSDCRGDEVELKREVVDAVKRLMPTRTLGTQGEIQSHTPRWIQPPRKMSVITLKVPLCCESCARKVKKEIKKLDGVEKPVICDLVDKKVTVTVKATTKPETVLMEARKVKRGAELWP